MQRFSLTMALKKRAGLFVSMSIVTLFALLSACVNTQTTLAENNNGSGFGGTGYVFQPDQEFGGTGHQRGFGGTGIIGTISAFGSIWVNGIEVEYDPNTPIKTPLGDEKHPLKLGQQVVVETLENTSAPLAKEIRIFIPIAGKITQRQGDWLIVGTEKIHILGQTYLDKKLPLQAGSYVAINGYRTAQHQWEATRINANPKRKTWLKTQLPIPFSKAVHALIVDPKLLPLLSGLEVKSNIMQTLPNPARTAKTALWVKGKMEEGTQGKRFQVERIDSFETQGIPKRKGPMIIDRPHPSYKKEGSAQPEMGQSRPNLPRLPQHSLENVRQLQQQKQHLQQIRESIEQQKTLQRQKEALQHLQELKEMKERPHHRP